ncbi:TRAP transporter small permease subunit [Halopseudomonas bauzanensis]|uniref:TRAP transporter small permease protein n=1 Tax=Halopseudomonas bauzanensis TaxID=653930 RepID=A0A031MCS4_9GAMM|nr:TRAP transporter small permease subunit [Halopseudomonas bauzanensis]EZQ18387.1 ABC transporter substrate-binding protein [Halopseudomonas bauzanensis]SES20889.1 TRAP-type mannitol/chloroaromatic compound transport system, small permease component [Halopseudomonas bauzanensis]SFM15086.1 TRAP-type mannitol/chloroaromatic compound transport system, small permease component [Halopseudomonas bauzanensis]
MRAISAFMNGVTKVNEWVGRILAYLVIPIFVFILIEVFLRYLFNAPTVWTNELTQMLFGLYAVLSGGYILAHRGHVNVDIFHATLPRRVQATVDIFTSVLFFIFVMAFGWFGYEMAKESIATWETSYSAWNPPIWPIKLAIPIGAGLLLLQGIVKLIQDIAIALGVKCPNADETGEAGDTL